mgnify:CR=1 FL=1
MKKYLNNKEGMALPMVLIIMAILMTFATSLALFAYDSLLSVRWMSNERKAYYLSRAGIEAASYAYQVASTSSTDYEEKSNLESLDAISKVVAAAKAGAPVTDGTEYSAPVKSNTIYAYYTTDDQEGNRFSGIKFQTSGNLNDDYCIGSFVVEIGKGIDLRQYKAPNGSTYEQSTMDVVSFRCTASCGDDTNRRYKTTYAYIAEAGSAKRLKLYDDYGVLQAESFTKAPQTTIDLNTGTVSYPTDDDRFIIGTINNINNFLKGLFKQLLINVMGGPTKTIQPYSFAHSGSLILDVPLKSKAIKAPVTVVESPNVVDHLYTVQTSENLFVKAGIDASAEKTGFTAIGLYGDQIVVDGDITMEVYITNPDAILANNPLTLTVAQTRFRIGTVIIGNATESGRQKDPIDGIKYIDENGKSVTPDGVNKIFFNGNVNLKVYTQGSTTQTYRVFSSGDIAYFYGSYVAAKAEKGGSKGIDLLKFFIDASLADLEGFRQNDATKKKLEQIKKLYYASDDSTYKPYVTEDGKTVLMRKIIVEEKTDGYYVDGSKSNIKEIIQPSEGAGAKITWGRPRHGDVWNNFEKVS